MGRPRKPAEARRREGGTGGQGDVSHRPIPAPVVVMGRDVPVTAPKDMPESARRVWEYLAAELVKIGILDKIDLMAFKAFCLHAARWEAISAFLGEPPKEQTLAELEARIQRADMIARALDQRIATKLRMGELPEAKDVRAAERYLTTIATMQEVLDAKRALGNVVGFGSMGQLVESPLAAAARAEALLMARFATEFALTPAARARLELTVAEGAAAMKSLEDELGPTTRGAIEGTAT
jgi:P27 family predicted phage terminase small subunit